MNNIEKFNVVLSRELIEGEKSGVPYKFYNYSIDFNGVLVKINVDRDLSSVFDYFLKNNINNK